VCNQNLEIRQIAELCVVLGYGSEVTKKGRVQFRLMYAWQWD